MPVGSLVMGRDRLIGPKSIVVRVAMFGDRWRFENGSDVKGNADAGADEDERFACCGRVEELLGG